MMIRMKEVNTINTIFLFIRTLQSLCEELVQQGLLKLPKNHRIQEFLGRSAYFCALTVNV